MFVMRGTSAGVVLIILTSTCVFLLPTCHGLQLVRRDGTNCTGNASECEERPAAYEDCPDPSLCEASTGDNVGLAFGLTFGAGLATTLGALLPFVPCIKRSSTNYLAAGLALAAGVMLYVSFTEIFDKSRFYICCDTPDHYYVAATACFFVGIMLTFLLDVVVWGLQKLDCGCSCGFSGWRTRHKKKEHVAASNLVSFSKHGCNGKGLEEIGRLDSNALIVPVNSSYSSTPTADSFQEGTEIIARSEEEEEEAGKEEGLHFQPNNDVIIGGGDGGSRQLESRCQTSISDGISVSIVSNTMSEGTNNLTGVSVNELFSNSSLQRMNAIIPETASDSVAAESTSHTSVTLPLGGEVVGEGSAERGEGKCGVVELPKDGLLRRNSYLEMVELQDQELESEGMAEFKAVTEVLIHDPKRLKRMGLLTGLAIGLHNFPEGLATFVATLSNPSLGLALAIAIALHNIPEGVCVSMPVYYATGSKWKAFMWAFLSGVSEPIGAFMGWLVLKELLGPLVYGIFFGIIAGMMVLITIKELLPTAFKFDKSNGVIIPVFLVIGMVVMAASLLLFLY